MCRQIFTVVFAWNVDFFAFSHSDYKYIAAMTEYSKVLRSSNRLFWSVQQDCNLMHAWWLFANNTSRCTRCKIVSMWQYPLLVTKRWRQLYFLPIGEYSFDSWYVCSIWLVFAQNRITTISVIHNNHNNKNNMTWQCIIIVPNIYCNCNSLLHPFH